jgi:serine phosphatase RsbU (regulator of sigma subunit)
MAELRNLLRALAVDGQAGPAETLTRLDRVTAHLAPELSGTAVYAQLQPHGDGGGLLRWSSAGHLPPVLLRGGCAEVLRTPADLMLGVRVDAERTEHVRELLPDDLLVLYTDGLVEERRSDLDDRLDGLARLLEQLGPDEPELLVDVLVERLASREDDVAVLVVRLHPSG